ncbi:dTDP-4-dehydrorhamnose reductase [Klebsiella oxytoca]|uniref:dTDP-4-dehydrorhamnose reductase n=1 Tax=Klebsiella oxytoca TaxID=571 RepID=UPI0032DA625C
MKILLTGANGQLGRCFIDRVPKDWDVFATDTSELDITNQDMVFETIKKYSPDIIVNAAAYTAVDKAESDCEIAMQVNAMGPSNLALASKKYSSLLIHISTDYVFDGHAEKPYDEESSTNPLSVYGKTKLDGELLVSRGNPESIIIRTAWVFSEYGNNFVKTMLKLGREKESLAIISDQFGCPTYAGDIAEAIISMIKMKAKNGIYHFCGNEIVSWHEFAKRIFFQAHKNNKLDKIPVINAITTSEYPTAATRPQYSVLNCNKISSIGIAPSDWNDRLAFVIDNID